MGTAEWLVSAIASSANVITPYKGAVSNNKLVPEGVVKRKRRMTKRGDSKSCFTSLVAGYPVGITQVFTYTSNRSKDNLIVLTPQL